MTDKERCMYIKFGFTTLSKFTDKQLETKCRICGKRLGSHRGPDCPNRTDALINYAVEIELIETVTELEYDAGDIITVW